MSVVTEPFADSGPPGCAFGVFDVVFDHTHHRMHSKIVRDLRDGLGGANSGRGEGAPLDSDLCLFVDVDWFRMIACVDVLLFNIVAANFSPVTTLL
jgi:hypothetical protein